MLAVSTWLSRSLAAVIIFAGVPAMAQLINLNAFVPFPPEDVMISLDGSEAVLTEGLDFSVFLENDPFFDDPVLDPSLGTTLSFEYDFVGTSGSCTADPLPPPDAGPGEFCDAFFVDAVDSSGDLLFSFERFASEMGTFSFLLPTDLIDPFAMFFELAEFDGDFGSNLSISQLEIFTPSAPVPVPEPGTLGLLLSGLAFLAWRRKQLAR